MKAPSLVTTEHDPAASLRHGAVVAVFPNTGVAQHASDASGTSRRPRPEMMFALALGGALGGMLSLPPALGIGLAYGLMWLAQSQGEAIIRTLHNATAAAAAAAPDAASDVTADHTFEEICAGYESHHYDPDSNALHTAGMALSAGMVLTALSGRKGAGLLVWVPPTWYGFAWVGHFFYQADIPAVFTYGMTLRGWASGEACSVIAACAGRSNPEPRDTALTCLIMSVWLLCAVHGAWLKSTPPEAKGKTA